jgi:hypothetical protein
MARDYQEHNHYNDHFKAARAALGGIGATLSASQTRMDTLVRRMRGDGARGPDEMRDACKAIAEHFARLAVASDQDEIMVGIAEGQAALREISGGAGK